LDLVGARNFLNFIDSRLLTESNEFPCFLLWQSFFDDMRESKAALPLR